jgi:hypothetical protein
MGRKRSHYFFILLNYNTRLLDHVAVL